MTTAQTPVKTEPVPPTVPQPQHLSKTNSKEKNDPLYHEAWFPEAGDEFVTEPDVQYIQSACDDLPVITEVTYKTTVATKVGFAKRVSESAWAYYLAVHVKARLLEIQAENQFETTPSEQRFIQQVKQGNYTLPELFTKYLSGFGNTTIPSGKELKFRMARPPDDAITRADDKNGWYGEVNADTHYLYKSYPSLPVYATRIQQDLRYSGIVDDDDIENPDELEDDDVELDPNARIWNLPPGIRCPEVGCGNPTENLLGYKYADKLNPDKIGFLISCGILPNRFNSVNTGDTLNIELMNGVDTEFKVVEHIKTGMVPTLSTGSIGQLPFLTTRRIARTTEIRQHLRPYSNFTKLGGTGYIGVSFAYRIHHLDSHGRKPWSVYDWDNFNNVPNDWTRTINRLREDEPEEISYKRFSQPEFLMVERIKEFMNKSVSVKT